MHTEQWHDETIPLGDFVLDSGTTLRNAHLAYSVSGTLNSAGNNLVVLPTHYGGAMKANRAWAEGKGLGEIRAMVDSTSDVSGDLVGAFRRAKELAGQIRAVYGEDEDKTTMLTALIRRVARDEVEVVG